jgi:tRNA nucleotidyltransferase (CCA-adding enzyme)
LVIQYPKNVVYIAEILSKNGYGAYAVGGCMRDAIMGRVPNDWDMTTDCSPEKMLEIFESEGIRTIPTGLKHGTVSVLLGGEIYECTTFRIDGSYTDSRHPDKVTFTRDISEDLRRRDFTCNAIAGNPLCDGDVVDLFGGRDDVERKLIRAVGDPEKRFTEDALRILRAVRFATVLDFEIDRDTLDAAKKLGERLTEISAERKSTELQKMLLSPHADRGISLLLDTDLAKYIHPDITYPKVMLSSLPERFSTRLAALFGSVPDLSRMKLSGEISRQTKALCDDALYVETTAKFNNIEAMARYMLSKYGEIAADAALLRGERSLAKTIVIEKAKNPAVAIKDLSVSGNDLLSAGIEAKKLGKIISSLLLSVIEDPTINEKTHLTTIALSLADRKE